MSSTGSTGAPPQASHSNSPQRVAVIAVHGVGSPPADETARVVAQLLMQSAPAGVQYTWSEERRIRVGTAKLDTGDAESIGFRKSLRQAFSGKAGDRTNLGARSEPRTQQEIDDNEEVANRPDIAFTRKLLRGYDSKNAPYSTIEIVGERLDHRAGARPSEVHVFEMHWADLSRLGSGLVTLLGAVYQLVQHISQIGRKTVDVAAQVAKARDYFRRTGNGGRLTSPALDTGPSDPWARYSWMHSWVIRIFTVLVPVATLLIFAFAPLFVPAAIATKYHLAIGASLAALIITVVGALVIYFGPADRWSATIFVAFMLAVVATAIYTITSRRADYAFGTALLVDCVALLSVGAYYVVVHAYNRTRSGARAFGLLAAALAIFSALTLSNRLYGGVRFTDAESVRAFAFVGMQWSYLLLMLTWGVLWAAVVAAIVLRVFLRLRLARQEKLRAARVFWTARVTLAGAVFSFIMALLVAARSIVYLADKASNTFNVFPRALAAGELPTLGLTGFFPQNFTCAGKVGQACAADFFVKLIGQSATSGFVIALMGLALVAVLASWFVVLIAATSVRTPDPQYGNSTRLGLWMTNGFMWMRRAGTVLAWTLLIAILAGIVIDYTPGMRERILPYVPQWLATRLSTDWTTKVIDSVALAILASAATLGAARLRLQTIATRARPAVGVVLDVDNYLRESPVDSTPRARIAERFVSLLRHLDVQGFDRIVIVSHSQGTVITADLLRFLNRGVRQDCADYHLIRPNQVYLLTMGTPLRQLYGANFPQLYAWVNATDPDPGATRGPLPAAATPPIYHKTPDPAELRVARWVNLYTSGDYVGRNLWCDDDWDGVWDRRAESIVGGVRQERCLGAGTHTHYWESPDVAAEIDTLISGPAIPSLQLTGMIPVRR